MFTWQAAAIILVVLIVLVLALAIAIYRLALNFALQAIRPKPVRYGAVLSEEVTRNHLDASLMDLKYDKLFLTNRRGQELTARLYPTASQTDRYILFVHGYNYPWIGALKYLRMLLDLGFNVFVPDMQAQGKARGTTSPSARWKATTAWNGSPRFRSAPRPTALTGRASASWGNRWAQSPR